MSYTSRRQKEKARRENRRAWLIVAEPTAAPEGSDQEALKPSEYGIRSITELVENEGNPRAVLYIRGSTRNQRTHIRHQAAAARLAIEELGCEVVATFGTSREENGKSLAPDERPELLKALREARELGLPLIAPCFSRFTRNPGYNPATNPEVRPTVSQLEQLIELAAGVQLYTLNDPDATPEDDNKYLASRGMRVAENKGGRPRKGPEGGRRRRYNKPTKIEWLDRVRKLYRSGSSFQEIANVVGEAVGQRFAASTMYRWIKEDPTRKPT